MISHQTQVNTLAVSAFLTTIKLSQKSDASTLIRIMSRISAEKPVMWGPSIVGFSTVHKVYGSGRQIDRPKLAFSPRKNALTIYFNEGFAAHADDLKKLGRYRHTVSCLYIQKIADIDLDVLTSMLKKSYQLAKKAKKQIKTVDDYLAQIPDQALAGFLQLRTIVLKTLPTAEELLSYGIIGYRHDKKRPHVFISAWSDHLAIYPVPKDAVLKKRLKTYIKGKGTLRFELSQPLPTKLISQTVASLAAE